MKDHVRKPFSPGSSSLLLLVPPEIRLHIYSYLLNDGCKKWLQIRNKPPFHSSGSYTAPVSSSSSSLTSAAGATGTGDNAQPGQDPPAHHKSRSSTTYHVMEQTSMFHRRCHKTTYHLWLAPEDAEAGVEMHPTILSVCRQTYHEGSEVLYGRHGFDFQDHIEAVVPFLQDRTPYSASLVQTISLYKRGPMPFLGSTSERHEWSYMCRYLASLSSSVASSSENGGDSSTKSTAIVAAATAAANTTAVKRLRLVVESGRPSQPWEGIQQLTEADIRLLSLAGGHDDVLEWVVELAQVQGLDALEVVSDEKYLPRPKSRAMAMYAALSASVQGGLVPYLRSQMKIPEQDGLRWFEMR